MTKGTSNNENRRRNKCSGQFGGVGVAGCAEPDIPAKRHQSADGGKSR